MGEVPGFVNCRGIASAITHDMVHDVAGENIWSREPFFSHSAIEIGGLYATTTPMVMFEAARRGEQGITFRANAPGLCSDRF